MTSLNDDKYSELESLNCSMVGQRCRLTSNLLLRVWVFVTRLNELTSSTVFMLLLPTSLMGIQIVIRYVIEIS